MKRARASTPSATSAPPAPGGAGGSAKLSVFVSGLPYDASASDVRAFFTRPLPGEPAAAGAAAAVPEAALLELRAPTYHDTGRLKGYAHIDLATPAALELALARDGKYLRDRFVTVERAKEPGQGAAERAAQGKGGLAAPRPRPAGCTTLFVKGLPYALDEAGVKAEVEPRFGAVLSVRLARHGATGNTKGFGYVQFETGKGAEAFMSVFRSSGGAGLVIGGRGCTCDWDEQQAPKASFRTATGQHFSKTGDFEHVRDAAHSRMAQPRPAVAVLAEASSSSSSSSSAAAPAVAKKGAKRENKGRNKGGSPLGGPSSGPPPIQRPAAAAPSANGGVVRGDGGDAGGGDGGGPAKRHKSLLDPEALERRRAAKKERMKALKAARPVAAAAATS